MGVWGAGTWAGGDVGGMRACMKRRGTFSGRKMGQIIRQLNSASPVENLAAAVERRGTLVRC